MKKSLLILAISFFISTLFFAQKIDQTFYDQANMFFQRHVEGGLIDYESLKGDIELANLISIIEKADVSKYSKKSKQAFYINAYNLLVINEAVKILPVSSVMEKGGFFDKQKINIGGRQMTLNALEKNLLLDVYNDPRLHFVLVCGAMGCPPITNFAYSPDQLESQKESQTRLAMNDPTFIRMTGDNADVSQIFKWYMDDFGGTKDAVRTFINTYTTNQIPVDGKLNYYKYDWSLNDLKNKSIGFLNALDQPTNASRYIVSSTIAQGSYEIKIFNNLYSQQTGNGDELTDRSSFFTTSISVLYGLSNRINIGINTRVRKVRNNGLPSSPFSVFGRDEFGNDRTGLTAFGPQVRYAPVPRWQNFSIQSSFVFPIGKDLAGSDTEPYIDWNGATWNTQLFNDFPIGTKFSLFTELDFLLEDIGKSDSHSNRFSTPVTTILSFTPSTKSTIYTLAGYSPYWQSEYDYFVQAGVGTKYQFTPNFEIEFLYTYFSNKFLADINGKAETINAGFRFNL